MKCKWFCRSIVLLAITGLLCLVEASDDDAPAPKDSSSPGWKEAPYDVSVLIGSFITFKCQTYIFHTETVWMENGHLVSNDSPRLNISSDNITATYGPVEESDSGMVLGCEVKTPYGMLPSHMGSIIVQPEARYNPKKIVFADVGKPFYLDFNYTSSASPFIYTWYKNGKSYNGDGSRVTFDHTGIVFSRVFPTDAGQYKVETLNIFTGEKTRAISTLQVILFKLNDHIQSASSSTPILSSKLAVTVALDRINSDSSSSGEAFHVSTNSSTYVSSYTENVIRFFMQFKKPSSTSRDSGHARVKTEKILLAIAGLVNNKHLTLSDSEMAMIADSSDCIEPNTPSCTLQDLRYRSADGTCNNFFYPRNGASGMPFSRILPANYEDGISAPVGLGQQLAGKPFEAPWPSPRHISWKIVRDIQPTNPLHLTHMFMQWGQFLDHDLDIAPVFDEESCGCAHSLRCIPIEVKPEDAVFGTHSSNNATCLHFSRSVPVCSRKALPRNQVNDLTSYIDASMVYGNNQEVADELRLFKGGLLKEGGCSNSLKGNLPVQEDSPDFSSLPFFVAGDPRVNEQLGLTMMHTIWLREHNRIARELMRINPCWKDERIYQETRKILGALVQIISYKEFLPLVFGPHFNTYVPRYRGYNPFVDATVPNSFAAAAYRFGHSLIQNQFERLDRDYKRLSIGPLPLEQAFMNPIKYFESKGTDPIMRGLTVVRSNPVDEFLNSILTSKLFVEPDKDLGIDLASLNIQRGRDHGLPTYRTWEKFCGNLFPEMKSSFARDDAEKRLKELYGEEGFREGMDLWLGGLAEKHIPGGVVGPTFACIFGMTFSRLRDGDRFWYKNPYMFTPRQKIQLEKVSLAKVICNNGDDIPTIQKSVFLTGLDRVKCSSLPEVNLWKWWDRRCYYHRHRY